MAIMDTDAELAAFQAKSRGGARTFMKIVIGLSFVGAATFVFAYYMPLLRAHRGLVQMHRETTERAQASQRSLASAEQALKTIKERKEELEADHERRASSERSESTRISELESELSSKLERHVQKGALVLSKAAGAVRATLGKDAFAAGKDEPSAKARGVLCDVAKAGGARALQVVVIVGESGWSQAAARGSALAETLVDKCQVSAERVSSAVRAPSGGAAPGAAALEIAATGGSS